VFDIPNLNFTLKEEELQKLILEAEEHVKKGKTIEELFHSYKEKYSIQEAFLILMQVRIRGKINPEFHNFRGNIRNR